MWLSFLNNFYRSFWNKTVVSGTYQNMVWMFKWRYLLKINFHRTYFFDSCFNGRLMLKQLNDLKFEWKRFIKMLQRLLAVREIRDILVVDEDLSKNVKTNQESFLVQPLISTPQKKVLPSNFLLRNNYSTSIYLLANKHSLREISTPLEIIWSVVFLHLNTSESSIFLQNWYSLVKPPY